MTGGGRPLRFLALVVSCWVGARGVMLWPGNVAIIRERPVVAQAQAEPPVRDALSPAPLPWRWPQPALPVVPAGRSAARVASVPSNPPPATATFPMTPEPIQDAEAGLVAGLPFPLASLPEKRSRWFGSAWAVARGGRAPAGGVPGVQLGGSQAGVRLGYALSDDRRLALMGRTSSPFGRGMRELALGVEWQPTRLPVRIVAERRFALNTGKGGPALAAVGGIGPVAIAGGFRLEAYAQGGVIGRDGVEGFADGAVRVARPVATLGDVRVDLGVGSWGAVQRGARRVDIGPSLSATLPIRRQAVRLSLDWRQRAAGNAAPGSGLVVTLGADF